LQCAFRNAHYALHITQKFLLSDLYWLYGGKLVIFRLADIQTAYGELSRRSSHVGGGLKMQDLKMLDQMTRVKNAGPKMRKQKSEHQRRADGYVT